MDDLIEALQIFRKYKNPKYPTHCEHDVMYICDVDRGDIPEEDVRRLDELGFFWSEGEDAFISFRFGSC